MFISAVRECFRKCNWRDFNVAAENTTLDWDIADERIVLSVSRTFSF